MEDQDVIELDSSDDEVEPPPKKRKPVPNAMVHIPRILPGITIKPTTKSKMIVNPFVNKLKSNSLTVSRTGKTVVYNSKEGSKPLQNKDHYGFNPVSINKTSKINQQAKKVISQQKQTVLKKSLPIKGPTVLNFLPSSITVKKASITATPMNIPSFSDLTKQKINIIAKPILSKELPTVNLDEEIQTTLSRKWYLRPGEERNKPDPELEESNDENTEDFNLEEQNNKEPETKKYVEIIIEDSPIKPVENNQNNEIGRELPIIIEDSPCKIKTYNEENNSQDKEKTVPQSKKKLNYPDDCGNTRQVVEIEIDPIETTTTSMENVETKGSENEMLANNKLETIKPINETDKKSDHELEHEFHATYRALIERCFEIENSPDMERIVEKRLKTYYKQCPKEYVESEEFIDLVSSKIMIMKSAPDKMYFCLKDIVDELNLQRKMAKSYQKENIAEEKKCEIASEDEGECDNKRLRQIRKLEKTIKKLHRAIQKLEEQEVDFDDEDDSVFILTERYKERLVRVHAKFCQMTNTKMPSEPRIVIETRPGRPLGPAKKLEKFINKKVPIGTPLPFPDFHDVLRCVRESNDEDKLGWNDMDIKEEARDLFVRCGRKLQRRRQENEWRIAVSRIPTDIDPAENNDGLKQKLNENKLVAAKRESELLNKYVDRQNQLKLEAVEIGDKEAEESPVESDEEEIIDASSSLENKQKRKERLRRLIHENGKKAMDENETSVDEKDNNQKEEIMSDENRKETIKNNENNEEMTNDENSKETINKNGTNEEKANDENSKETEPHNSTSDNIVDLDADDLNNNDDKETESVIYEVDSDVDELNLLQKLHFADEISSSSSYSTDSDTPIAISDTLESSSNSENERMICSDVISIENSSYSESETLAEAEESETLPIHEKINEDVEVHNSLETEYSANANNDTVKTNNEDIMENILLASSEEDVPSEKDVFVDKSQTCINLNDDAITVTETLIRGEHTGKDSDTSKIEEVTNNECTKNEISNKNIISQSDILAEPKDYLNEVALTLRDDTTSECDVICEKDHTKDLGIGEEEEIREASRNSNNEEELKT